MCAAERSSNIGSLSDDIGSLSNDIGFLSDDIYAPFDDQTLGLDLMTFLPPLMIEHWVSI